MSEPRFDILFSGELMPGFTPDGVRENLSRLFKATPETIARLMGGGTHAVKKNADLATAEKYREAMQRAGARAELRQSGTPASAPSGTPTASPERTAAAEPAALSVAPVGIDLLAADERRRVEAPAIDTSHIKLASVFGASVGDERPAPPPAPDTSHISVAAVGEDLNPVRDGTAPPPPPDTSAISLAPPGERLGPERSQEATLVPDISGITLAPPGAPLDEIRPSLTPVNPDISNLRLAP